MIGELFDPHVELFIGEHYRPHWSPETLQIYRLMTPGARLCLSLDLTVEATWQSSHHAPP